MRTRPLIVRLSARGKPEITDHDPVFMFVANYNKFHRNEGVINSKSFPPAELEKGNPEHLKRSVGMNWKVGPGSLSASVPTLPNLPH
jgi:hypothetical protein